MFLVNNPDVTIEVYEGRTGEALGHLARRGFKEIRELSDNPVTDFRKFTARKADTGNVALVVVQASRVVPTSARSPLILSITTSTSRLGSTSTRPGAPTTARRGGCRQD